MEKCCESVEKAQGVLIEEADAIVHAIGRRLTERGKLRKCVARRCQLGSDGTAAGGGLLPFVKALGMMINDMSVCDCCLSQKKGK